MSNKSSSDSQGGLKLVFKKKFWPLFLTQFFGAFNDNLLKNALVILITFKSYSIAGLAPEQVVALCGGVFILPFFLFSALAGQITDKYSKSTLMIWIKIWEILVMIVASIGFFSGNFPLLIFSLFMMGLQSTFFGPAKYSCLPELLSSSELVSGNAYVELGTFLAILLGTIFGGLLISMPKTGHLFVSGTLFTIAVLGWISSLVIKKLPPVNPQQKIQGNFFKSTIDIIQISRRVRSVFLSILGISWFWMVGAVMLSILPAYCKDTIGSNETVVTFFLALFSLGVGLGSLICEKLSFRQLELGLVPIGSFGLTVFAVDLFIIGQPSLSANPEHLVTVQILINSWTGWRIIGDLLLFALFGGFFIVPLYTLIQQRSDRDTRSQTIAANNILNALFMVIGALLLMLLFTAGANIPQIFLVMALLNLAVAVYIYTILPEFLFRLICWVISHLLYRLKVDGRDNIPLEGPAVLVCNHVTFVDWLIIAGITQRPIRFVMHYSFLNIPLTGRIFRDAKVIPIAGSKENPSILDSAFDRIAEELREGELVCVFPEGHVTFDGRLDYFRPGIERIIQQNPVPVIPLAMKGMWGSVFSRKYQGYKKKLRHNRLWTRVSLFVGKPIAPGQATADHLHDIVSRMLEQSDSNNKSMV